MSAALTAQSPEILAALHDVFGFEGFRPGQAEIIDQVLAGHPTLAVMPTGAGKSICYQLPALVTDGLTVVVSPLIALINDQVNALKAVGIEAAAFTSAESFEDRQAVLAAIRKKRLKLLYLAPERFRGDFFREILASSGVALFAIDEAHCISTWGHDFRPDYARLGEVLRELAPPRIIALTATATPEVRADIIGSLGLTNWRSVVTGFDRPNLELAVKHAAGAASKIGLTESALRRWLGDPKAPRGSAIIYAGTRKRSERVAGELFARGWRAAPYHAGLSSEKRARVHDRFVRGKTRVVVATTAFGMGIDQADVRLVVHFDIPSSVEAYYQEVGRAGRDAEPAGGVLLFDPADLRLAYRRLEASCPTREVVVETFRRLMSGAKEGWYPGELETIVEALEPAVGPACRAALVTLERAGAIRLLTDRAELLKSAAEIDDQALERRLRLERSKLEAMLGYVKRAACRRRYLVDYFGDPHRPERCGSCDRCTAPSLRVLEGEPLNDALKALSCVARMRGRFGKHRVAEVLAGSSARVITEARLDRLSTYGLLRELRKEEIFELLDALAGADLLDLSVEEYPKLRLTEKGADCLRARGPVALELRLRQWGDPIPVSSGEVKRARSKKGGAKAAQSLADRVERATSADPELLGTLRRWRNEAAKGLNCAPYVVAPNALLEALASQLPDDLGKLTRVSGMGPMRMQRFASPILAIVRAHLQVLRAG